MKKKDYFIPKMFYKLLIPSVCSSFGFALADMVDALVLGQRIGETGLAAISLCLPLFMLINIFMDSLGIGGSVYFSQKLGEGNTEKAVDCFNRIWISVLFLGLCIGIFVNCFPNQILMLFGVAPKDGVLFEACKDYMKIIGFGAPFLMLNIVFSNFLRNDNNAVLASRGFFVGSATDIILNIILVLFWDMGTKGAALSTVIGSIVAILLYLPAIIGKEAEILKIKQTSIDLKEIWYCFRIGFSTSIQHLFQLVFLLVINNFLMNLSGESGVAVFDLVYNISFFIVYLFNGVAEAAQPLISTFCGENSEEDCQYVLHLSQKYGMVFGALMAAVLFIFASNVSRVFGISEDIIPLAVRAVRIYCMGFAFIGLNILYGNYYQAKEKTRFAFGVVALRNFVILLPCVILFSHTGIENIWLLYPVTELVSLLIFYLYRKIDKSHELLFDKRRILRIIVENEAEDMGIVIDKSMEFCEKWEATPQQQYSVTLIIEELCMSIIKNGMINVPERKIRITLLAMEDGDFVLNLLDNAVVFNPFLQKTKKVDLNEDFDIDDISMMIIKKKSKKFMYRRCNGFNSLVVRI